jgi:6-phosphogluconolactonase
MAIERHDFPDRDALAERLAARIAGALGDTVSARGRATLALSGGRTPGRFFEALSRTDAPWSRISVLPVDERWVDESSDRSNAASIRRSLLTDQAAEASFLPLYTGGASPEAARDRVEGLVAALPQPFAAVVLGMGEDGHTASWFPGGDRLASALDPAGQRLIESMLAPAAGEPRITLTLPPVLRAGVIALHIEGKAKLAVLQRALDAGDEALMPIRAVLRRATATVEIYWCP